MIRSHCVRNIYATILTITLGNIFVSFQSQNDGFGLSFGNTGDDVVHEQFRKVKTYKGGFGAIGNILPSFGLHSSSASSSSSFGTKQSSSFSAASGNSINTNSNRRPCTNKPKAILNASTKCSIVTNSCIVQCLDNYQFPSGDSKMKMLCDDGEWTLENIEWSDKLACERKR